MREAQEQAGKAIANRNQKQNINLTTQQLATEYTDPNQIMFQNQPQAYGQPYGQPAYGQPYVQPPMMTQPIGQPMYGSPEQALFGQPPVYPNTGNGGYGPNPIIR